MAYDNMADILDSRYLITRLNELVDMDDRSESEQDEYDDLADFLAELRDLGTGDSPEDGMILVRDSYFPDYAQELAEDTGAISSNMGWPLSCIDWEQAAAELQMDYISVEYNDTTYWTR